MYFCGRFIKESVMFVLENVLRPNVKRLKPYSSARDEFPDADLAGVFLDANENPYGNLNRYPDPYQRELKKAISSVKGVDVENIFLGNGSDEVIDIAIRTFCSPREDKIMQFTPTYGMYGVSAEINDIEVINIPLDDNFQIDYAAAEQYFDDKHLKIIFICSPNNPSGNNISIATIEKIIKEFDGIVIVDEAYNDFSETTSFNQRLSEFPNLIVMQTFSKAYGLASVRVGMAFMSVEIISFFNKMKPPYNISKLNQQAALEQLADVNKIDEQKRAICSEREIVAKELASLPIIKKIYPSNANFLLVETTDATSIYNYLVEKRIIVRNRNTVVGNCLRITIGTSEQNRLLIEALSRY